MFASTVATFEHDPSDKSEKPSADVRARFRRFPNKVSNHHIPDKRADERALLAVSPPVNISQLPALWPYESNKCSRLNLGLSQRPEPNPPPLQVGEQKKTAPSTPRQSAVSSRFSRGEEPTHGTFAVNVPEKVPMGYERCRYPAEVVVKTSLKANSRTSPALRNDDTEPRCPPCIHYSAGHLFHESTAPTSSSLRTRFSWWDMIWLRKAYEHANILKQGEKNESFWEGLAAAQYRDGFAETFFAKKPPRSGIEGTLFFLALERFILLELPFSMP